MTSKRKFFVKNLTLPRSFYFVVLSFSTSVSSILCKLGRRKSAVSKAATMRETRFMCRIFVLVVAVLLHGAAAFAPTLHSHRLLVATSTLSTAAATHGSGSVRCKVRASFRDRLSQGTPLPFCASLKMWSRDDELEGANRLKACIPYILPLLDGDQFGRYIYLRFPLLANLNDFFLGPLLTISHKIPFFTVGFFIMLTLGTRFNTEMDRNVRFSAQQAALIDVALIFPELIASTTGESPLPRGVVEPCNNFIYYAYMFAVVSSVYRNLRGKKPDHIPYISPFSDLMVGPF
jgi:hypothetical protein